MNPLLIWGGIFIWGCWGYCGGIIWIGIWGGNWGIGVWVDCIGGTIGLGFIFIIGLIGIWGSWWTGTTGKHSNEGTLVWQNSSYFWRYKS